MFAQSQGLTTLWFTMMNGPKEIHLIKLEMVIAHFALCTIQQSHLFSPSQRISMYLTQRIGYLNFFYKPGLFVLPGSYNRLKLPRPSSL